MQDMALASEENMPMFIRCGIMALVAAYLNFLSQMIANPPFCQHVSKVGHRLILTSLSRYLTGRHWFVFHRTCEAVGVGSLDVGETSQRLAVDGCFRPCCKISISQTI